MAFEDQFSRDDAPAFAEQGIDELSTLEPCATGISQFLAIHAGSSYCQGLYRIPDVAAMPKWTKIVLGAFPDFRNRLFCFGFDWLGRAFALDSARTERGQHLVLLLEPGTGEALEIPASFMDFHNRELLENADAALSAEFFTSWRRSGGASPGYLQCIGYKIPLFRNGSDTIDNLAPVDTELYWSMMGRLLEGVRLLPDGTPIRDIRLVQ